MTTTGYVDIDPAIGLPKAAGEVCLFKYVPADEIPEFTRKLARKLTDRAAADFGLGRVGIKWFRYVGFADAPPPGVKHLHIAHLADEEPMADFHARAEEAGEIIIGATRIGEHAIGILEAVRGQTLAAVVAHEVRHVHQNRLGMTDRTEMEADAEAYSSRFVRRVKVA